MLTRRLALKKESLAPLTSEDMAVVGGAAAPASVHTLELGCWVEFSPSFFGPTQCCQGIPTFHRAAC